MGIFAWFKRKKSSPISDYELSDDDRADGQEIIKLKKEMRRLEFKRKAQELREDIEEMKANLHSGDSNPLEEMFLMAIMQKFGVNLSPEIESASGSNSIQVSQPNLQKLQTTFMSWANENKIPMDKLQDLKNRIEKSLNT